MYADSGYVSDSTDCNVIASRCKSRRDRNPRQWNYDDCDSYIDEFGLGIFELEYDGSSLAVFPNPGNGTFYLSLITCEKENTEATIDVLNLLGQIIFSEITKLIKQNYRKTN
jgi:hypothetical protein